jgi:hypothetical protein
MPPGGIAGNENDAVALSPNHGGHPYTGRPAIYLTCGMQLAKVLSCSI